MALLLCFAGCAQAPAPVPASAPAPSPASRVSRRQLVDLSHAYDGTTVFWPTAEAFRLEKVADGMTPDGYYYAANNFFTSEHGGTHLDAPVHFAQGGADGGPDSARAARRRALVVDVAAKADANPDYQVTTDDIQQAETAARTDSRGRDRPAADRILAPLAGCRALPRHGASAAPAPSPKLHFPGLHPDAARWLVANRPVKRLASTPPASTTASPRCSKRTGCSTSATCPRSRT